MDFIKKNWEKVLLGAVLIGLLVAVVGLPIKIASEKAELESIRVGIIQGRVAPIDAPDLTGVEKALARTQQPVLLDLTTSNRVVNPVQWKRSPSGQLIRVLTGEEVGVGAVVVDSISPLYLIISLDSVLSSDSGTRYAIGIERQAEQSKRARVKRQTYAAVGEKNDNFLLRDVKGPVEQPTAVELELSDTGERITVSAAKPYQRVDGYMADLSYPPDSRKWAGKRVGDSIQIERETYNIVAISKDEVVLSAPSGKKTTLKSGIGN
jgi:hypothetical protein